MFAVKIAGIDAVKVRAAVCRMRAREDWRNLVALSHEHNLDHHSLPSIVVYHQHPQPPAALAHGRLYSL